MIGKGFGKRFEAFLMKEGWMVGTSLMKEGLGDVGTTLTKEDKQKIRHNTCKYRIKSLFLQPISKK
jgi:hypothetical protein